MGEVLYSFENIIYCSNLARALLPPSPSEAVCIKNIELFYNLL